MTWKLSTFALVGIAVLLIFIIVYQKKDYHGFYLLSAQPSSLEIRESMGEPSEIISGSAALSRRGWNIPRYIPENTTEIWIYDIITGRRFYVFVGPDGQTRGFFSSSS